jgi:hypothetical protein
MSDLVVCTNPECGKEYEVENRHADDGFCSQECWEHMHCGSPKTSNDIFEVTAESLLTA